MPDSFEFKLGSFGAFCKNSYVKLFKGLRVKQFSFTFKLNFMESMVIEGWGSTGYYFWAICQIKKKIWQFIIFVNTGPYAAGN